MVGSWGEECPFGESVPEINYWVKGDGCCEVEDDEDELCEPKISLEEYNATKRKTRTKASIKPTDKPETKPSSNDVDSGLVHQFRFQLLTVKTINFQDWTSWSSSSNKNPTSWDLPDADDFNRGPDIDYYRPPQVPDINQAIENNPTLNRPVRPG